MKNLLILGAGTAGTIMAYKMRKDLSKDEWIITVVERERNHFYQPGFLFIPFGYYKRADILKKGQKFIPAGVEVIYCEIDRIDAESNRVRLIDGATLDYDILVIATGVRLSPEDTPGLKGDLWYKNIFDFYSIEGSEALFEFFRSWEGGKLVINVADNPVKCPVAPLEFAFYADEFFTKKGIRNNVEITYVTPNSGAFTKPKASKLLGSLLSEKSINLVNDFFLAEVDNINRKILDFSGREVSFDCLITVPLHVGDPVIIRSGLGDEFGFVRAHKNTLQSVLHKNIFVIGDAGNFPASKAGSVAHFQADVLHENLISYINNEQFHASYDGHSNCFIETGYGKGILIDFNYDTEPLPGVYPIPFIGPLSLLRETRLNHYGKVFFKWIYWNILLKGRRLPVSNKMSMKGKRNE